jgi:hypothetical protein
MDSMIILMAAGGCTGEWEPAGESVPSDCSLPLS